MALTLAACFYFYSTEQIKPEHIVGEDSLDNDEDSNKGEILDHVYYSKYLSQNRVFKHFDATDSKCPCTFVLRKNKNI